MVVHSALTGQGRLVSNDRAQSIALCDLKCWRPAEDRSTPALQAWHNRRRKANCSLIL
jgi:hypothetical protein